jgi:AcrR family transcriptional regulator
MEPPVTGTTESVARGSLRGGHAAMRKPKAPEQNRRRILRAAIEEFAARGFKGASMDAIASRTHTTRALINYYFGSKEKLYVEVLEHVYAEIREAEARLEIEHLTPIEAIRRIAQFTFHYYVEHEHFVQLVVAENQARGRHLGKSVSMQALNRPIVDRLALVLERGQREGAFRPDADPVEVHKAIAALGIFNMTNRHTFGAIFQREMGAKGDVDGRCRVAIDIVLSYLTNLAGPTEVSRPQP